MELRDFTSSMRMHRTISAALILLTGAAALVFSFTKPDWYDTSISFAVNRVNRQTTAAYEYDGYYAIQAADLFSQTVVSWFSTPSVVVEMYQKANLDPKLSSIENLSGKFRTRKYSSQNIVVRYASSTRNEADALSQSIISVVTERSSKLNQAADAKSIFSVVASDPVTVLRHPNIIFNAAIGLLLGIVLAIFAVSGTVYFRSPAP